jgi:hypothetical protein
LTTKEVNGINGPCAIVCAFPRKKPRSEVSSIDTSILLCGVLAARAYFGGANAQIQSLATQIYEQVNWPWMLNGGATFSIGWLPDSGFLTARYETYCELMMLYLLAIGSPTYPVALSCWDNFARPILIYDGYTAWGGPLAQGPIDGTVVPCAATGSLAFDSADCYSVLNALLASYGNPAWGWHGFVDAFHPVANWYDTDCIGID